MIASNPLGGNKPFDAVTDVLIPGFILGMVCSFANFLMDIREAQMAQSSSVLRNVCFWFLLGVVCISRLNKKYGGSTVATPYILGLGGAMFLFLVRWSEAAGTEVFWNCVFFAGAWWAIHRLTDECTVEENVADEGDAGLLGGLLGRGGNRSDDRARRRHPGRLVITFGLAAAVAFAALQSEVPPAARLRALGWMIMTYFFALSLLATTSLSGLRIYVKQRGATLPSGIPRAWVTASIVVTLVLLGLTALLPRGPGADLGLAARWFSDRQEFALGEPTSLGDAPIEGIRRPHPDSRVSLQLGETQAPRARPEQGNGPESGEAEPEDASPRKDLGAGQPPNASSSTEQQGSQGTQEQPGQQSGGGGKADPQNAARDRSRAAAASSNSAAGGGSGSDNTGQSQGATSGSSSGRATSFGSGPGASWWWLILLLLLAYMAYRWYKKNRARLKNWLSEWRRIPEMMLLALRHFIEQVRAWLALWASRFRRGAGPATSPKKALRIFSNPFADPNRLAQLTPEERIRRTYEGILYYAAWVGCARRDDQTPIEYLRALPQPLEARKGEIGLVTGLYIQAAYTRETLTDDQLRELPTIWEAFRGDITGALPSLRPKR